MCEQSEKFILSDIGFLECLGLKLQRVPLRRYLLALPVEFEKYIRFTAQNIRLDRLMDEIDGACLVTTEAPLGIGISGGHEDDGDMAGTLITAHQLGQFEAVQS